MSDNTLYPIFETHTHLYFSAFDNDLESVLSTCKDAGVSHQVQIGCEEVSSMAALALAQKYEGMYATLGVHPCDVLDCFSAKKNYRPSGFESYELQAHNFQELFSFFSDVTKKQNENVVGFGETGFDLYHNNSPEILARQYESFEMHIQLARLFRKPLVFHVRDAYREFEEALRTYKVQGLSGVVHCFSSDTACALKMTQEYGFFIGIGGVLTYPKSDTLRDVVRAVPLEYLVTETDSPFLVPQQARKNGVKRNDASTLKEVVQLIAHIKNIDEYECGLQLFENAKKLYSV